ncbi:hypothetical protein [Candidatus Methanoperedens nitratireducens]|uniref:Uncharacterized protein n=1 Tax=Candidatus Methanoperedens nitratireducens TaxID=1392998 RepID=A0A284VMX7_9EURY|nr:hypothetical protein [Candidatus Methanoperedens nitroreducens]SNQ60636.1 membrane hypothetical protein [Candidatus Methanoperedens nitroreducens]
MTEAKSTKVKSIIPFDQPIKIALLFFHFIGFSIWYGGAVIGAEASATFPVMAVVSGVLLVVRELYKDGFVWLIVTEGALTIVKVALLVVASTLMRYEVPILSIVILCGLLSSHLPERIREKLIVGWGYYQ